MTTDQFDVIVIGTGAMGSAACYYLARAGMNVLGIDQYASPHEHGSHTGQSRIIRKAYFEHADYVPLLARAYSSWKTFEHECRTQLYHETGVLYAGHPGHSIIKGVKESARRYGITLEIVNRDGLAGRFPAFSIPPAFEVLFEPEAGFLVPERVIILFLQKAREHGATLLDHTHVRNWSLDDDSIKVNTVDATYSCRKLIITAGARTAALLPSMSATLNVTRQVLGWFEPQQPEKFALNSFPCWLIADENYNGAFYGFPVLPVAQFGGPSGVKLAHHYPGETVDPDTLDRSLHTQDEELLKHAVDTYFPGEFSLMHSYNTCMYTNTPDENFVVDFVPNTNKRVVVAAGFSGHGFKFVPVIGEILCDLVMEGVTHLPIDFLRMERFGRKDKDS